MYPCALRGGGPDTWVPGPFASRRSVQGAAPLEPLRGYPCTLTGKVHPRPSCTFPVRLKSNTVTFDCLPDTAGKRSFILPRRRLNIMKKSREELEKSIPKPKLKRSGTSAKSSGWKTASWARTGNSSLTLFLPPTGEARKRWNIGGRHGPLWSMPSLRKRG